MAFSISKLARMTEFNMALNSIGNAIFVSLNTTHLSQAQKKLTAAEVPGDVFVRWLFDEMARQPDDAITNEHDPSNNPRFTPEELTKVTCSELDAFASKLIQQNKYQLLKTYRGRDIEKKSDESACDFCSRAFRHCAVEEKKATERMKALAFPSAYERTATEAMQKASVFSSQNALFEYTKAAEVNKFLASAYLTQADIAATESMKRAFGTLGPSALRQYEEVAKVKQKIASTSSSIWGSEYSNLERIDRYSTISEVLSAQAATQRHLMTHSPSEITEARRIAELAQTYTLPASLASFRTSAEPFAVKLLHLQSLDTIHTPAYLSAFMQTSTISDIFAESIRADRQLRQAALQFSEMSLPAFDKLSNYGRFLDAAGLGLPHWPHVRLLTIGEKRRRFHARLKGNSELTHVKNAKSLVHRYEITLRQILDSAMASEYGEDWAPERLPLCDCKDLLGKWEKRGGEVLDHADYAHYERIMSSSEHFVAVFETGFDDRTELARLIRKAGDLRAALQHFRPFSAEDLRDLRLTWKTIETGLLALTDDYDFGI